MPTSQRAIGKDHVLTLALRQAGWSSRNARDAVNAVFEIIKDALQSHETVDTPIGRFRVVEHPVKPYRKWRYGRPVEFYRSRFHVVFEPYEVLER